MQRITAAVALILVFLWQVVVAGLTTAWIILRPGRRPSPVLMRLSYDGISPLGAASLACLVTLTPGTSTIDLNLERRSLLVHMLDGRHSAQLATAIRERFERRLRIVFPEARA